VPEKPGTNWHPDREASREVARKNWEVPLFGKYRFFGAQGAESNHRHHDFQAGAIRDKSGR
jgi:hypothetical protein